MNGRKFFAPSLSKFHLIANSGKIQLIKPWHYCSKSAQKKVPFIFNSFSSSGKGGSFIDATFSMKTGPLCSYGTDLRNCALLPCHGTYWGAEKKERERGGKLLHRSEIRIELQQQPLLELPLYGALLPGCINHCLNGKKVLERHSYLKQAFQLYQEA